jgi:glycosyltransferase involved in cell wall biosynthesis
MRIAIVSNTAWYLFNFRLNLMRALLQAGHEVVAVAPQDEYVARIEAVGATFAHVSINGRGVNPLREALTVGAFWQIFRHQRVDMVLSYTPKGNLYSALACRMLGKRFVPNVSGLGHAAIHRSWASVASQLLYRLTFGRATRVFFQNEDDMAYFLAQGFVRADQVQRLPGSGVDLQRFVPVPLPEPQADVVFLFMARLLKEKGIHEYVQAARMVRSRHPGTRFLLAGFTGGTNPSAVSQAELDAWVAAGDVEYLGRTDEPEVFLAQATCVVLPSYREGMPRVLLEAAACGRAVITTDAPGCREAVQHGKTGFMTIVKSAQDLASKMEDFIALSPTQRAQMGQQGRTFMEERFGEQKVLEPYLALVKAESAKA